MTRYDMVYALATPIVVPWLAWRRVTRGKYTESAEGMMGRRLPDGEAAAAFGGGSLWLHAVSVGEIGVARAVAPGLSEAFPELRQVVSTVTETGQAAARGAFGEDHCTYFPLDVSFVVKRFQRVYRPEVFVLMETELWPNFLCAAHKRGTRCYMINAKLSDRSFPRYQKVRRFMRPALEALAGVCVQTGLDAERFEMLGVPGERIRVTGNCKLDLPQEPLSEEQRQALRAELGMGNGRRWIVAGSTHDGEEKMILDALRTVRERHPDVGLLMCPRHPDRFAEVADAVRADGWRMARASEAAGAAGSGDEAEVVVLDRMGVLARAYGAGDVAIVAGSFCEVGGHNVLEAAAHGVPVVYGPRMHSQRELQRLMREGKAGIPGRGEQTGRNTDGAAG